MGFWKKLFRRGRNDVAPQRLDYLNEALALERQGDFAAAITSYRLALRDNPVDPRVLQNMAIAFTKISNHDDAIRYYRRALEVDPTLAGAHYGVAFLYMKRGEAAAAKEHLEAFLGSAPSGPDSAKWVEHAQQTLTEICAAETD
ncbi:MAG: tetratricopeptide repeat protein [Gemmatimonadetes bacterium]|nr:tetratricopeptide repeat protein [Gemmatimonadota bacterium]MCZ6761079.1 tetratricopeptide repeat protein [Gemmatimonadota bacterium]